MVIGKTRTNQPVEKEQGFDTEVHELMEQGEPMSGYSATLGADSVNEFVAIYIGVCKNGNKLTFTAFGKLTKLSTSAVQPTLVDFTIPESVGQKLYPFNFGGVDRLDIKSVDAYVGLSDHYEINAQIIKLSNTKVKIDFNWGNLPQDTESIVRFEITFLLSENLIPEE